MSSEPKGALSRIQSRVFETAPRILAGATFLAGALALVSAASPGNDLGRGTPLAYLVSEAPAVTLAFGGLVLMVLSVGLLRRIKAAWALAILVAAHGLAATIVFKSRLPEELMYAALLAALLFARKSFYRRSALNKIQLSWTWFLSAFLAVALAAFVALLWVSHQAGFVEASFFDLIIHPALGATGRPLVLVLVLLAVGAFFKFFATPDRHIPPAPADADLEKLANLLRESDAPRPDNLLAFAGDKSISFGPDQQAAIAFADLGGFRVAMGMPIGPRGMWKSALEHFMADAKKNALTPAIYSVPPDALPLLLELDLRVEKIGENGILELPEFSLAGARREGIRRGRRKLAERAGATFLLSEPPHDPALLERLRPVSDAWLKANGGREKSFSLGRFSPALLNRSPVGIVELNGVCAAFGSLFVTPDKSWAGIDQMRYDPASSVTNTMDFLLVELILWAKAEGYQRFDLAMAPLAGLVDEKHAPLFAQVGHFIYERSGQFYNFQGLRRFKEKFAPVWEPRYLAAPEYWALPFALAQVALLTSGRGKIAPGEQ